jgi:hypothetical protein
MIEATTIEMAAIHDRNVLIDVSAITASPKIKIATFKIEKTPALTTATAWRSADTGVGATIALGSHG